MGAMDRDAVSRRQRPHRFVARLAAAGLLLAGAGAIAAGDLTGQTPPDFALKSSAGQNLRLSEFRGGVVLVNFWAGWCGRCSTQLARLADLQKRYAGQGLQVLAVNIDRDDRKARDMANRLGLTVLRDSDQAVARQYDLNSLPLTLLVDADGKVRQVHENYRDGDEDLYEAELQTLLRN